jgi:hypothetical protein
MVLTFHVAKVNVAFLSRVHERLPGPLPEYPSSEAHLKVS